MGERQEAPGELERLREFVNTVDIDQGREQLGHPAGLVAWLAEHELVAPGAVATPGDLRRALELREALRAILLSHNGGPAPPPDAVATLEAVARKARVRLHFDDRGVSTLMPEAKGVDGALGALTATVHAAIADGTWRRLKACREHSCEWAFYDQTRNRSRAWCNMQVCGNRAKARAYRQRHG